MSENPLVPSIRASGGTPAGLPDYKPLNRMKPEEVRKLLSRPPRPQLFQVWVEEKGKMLPVGPKVVRPVADSFAAAVRRQIILGAETRWSSPQVLAV